MFCDVHAVSAAQCVAVVVGVVTGVAMHRVKQVQPSSQQVQATAELPLNWVLLAAQVHLSVGAAQRSFTQQLWMPPVAATQHSHQCTVSIQSVKWKRPLQ